MFASAYHLGPAVEVYAAGPKTAPNLMKIPGAAKRSYDKEVKGYVMELDGGREMKAQFPASDKDSLALRQPFLVLQVYVPHGKSFGIEICVVDQSKTRRRINLSSHNKEIAISNLHVRLPFDYIRKNMWLNLCIDVENLFKDTFGKITRIPGSWMIDSFQIMASCKLRKVFTCRDCLRDDEAEEYGLDDASIADELPRSFEFPAGVEYFSQVVSLQKIQIWAESMLSAKAEQTKGSQSPRSAKKVLKNGEHIAFGSRYPVPAGPPSGTLTPSHVAHTPAPKTAPMADSRRTPEAAQHLGMTTPSSLPAHTPSKGRNDMMRTPHRPIQDDRMGSVSASPAAGRSRSHLLMSPSARARSEQNERALRAAGVSEKFLKDKRGSEKLLQGHRGEGPLDDADEDAEDNTSRSVGRGRQPSHQRYLSPGKARLPERWARKSGAAGIQEADFVYSTPTKTPGRTASGGSNRPDDSPTSPIPQSSSPRYNIQPFVRQGSQDKSPKPTAEDPSQDEASRLEGSFRMSRKLHAERKEAAIAARGSADSNPTATKGAEGSVRSSVASSKHSECPEDQGEGLLDEAGEEGKGLGLFDKLRVQVPVTPAQPQGAGLVSPDDNSADEIDENLEHDDDSQSSDGSFFQPTSPQGKNNNTQNSPAMKPYRPAKYEDDGDQVYTHTTVPRAIVRRESQDEGKPGVKDEQSTGYQEMNFANLNLRSSFRLPPKPDDETRRQISGTDSMIGSPKDGDGACFGEEVSEDDGGVPRTVGSASPAPAIRPRQEAETPAVLPSRTSPSKFSNTIQRLTTPPIIPPSQQDFSAPPDSSLLTPHTPQHQPHTPFRMRGVEGTPTPKRALTHVSEDVAVDPDPEQLDQDMGDQMEEEEDLELMYDPILNCYWDPRNNKFYELKNP